MLHHVRQYLNKAFGSHKTQVEFMLPSDATVLMIEAQDSEQAQRRRQVRQKRMEQQGSNEIVEP